MSALPPRPPPGAGLFSSPAQRLLTDLRRFELTEPAWYAWSHRTEDFEALALVVPQGFRHDFASVPRALWALIAPIDLGLASLFHDWIYRHGGRIETLGWRPGSEAWSPTTEPWSRRDADRLFSRMMREQGVVRWRRRWAFRAVQWFGSDGWRGPEHLS